MGAGQAYKTAIMMSEVPGIDWIAKGWRGAATYLMAAANRMEAGDRGAKAQKVDRATRLLTDSVVRPCPPPPQSGYHHTPAATRLALRHLRPRAADPVGWRAGDFILSDG